MPGEKGADLVAVGRGGRSRRAGRGHRVNGHDQSERQGLSVDGHRPVEWWGRAARLNSQEVSSGRGGLPIIMVHVGGRHNRPRLRLLGRDPS